MFWTENLLGTLQIRKQTCMCNCAWSKGPLQIKIACTSCCGLVTLWRNKLWCFGINEQAAKGYLFWDQAIRRNIWRTSHTSDKPFSCSQQTCEWLRSSHMKEHEISQVSRRGKSLLPIWKRLFRQPPPYFCYDEIFHLDSTFFAPKSAHFCP